MPINIYSVVVTLLIAKKFRFCSWKCNSKTSEHFFISKVLHWKMVAKLVGLDAPTYREDVIGVEQMVGAVGKIGLEMTAMVLLVEKTVINAYLDHKVCLTFLILINLGSCRVKRQQEYEKLIIFQCKDGN